MTLKLDKKETNFLYVWLADDLDLQIENKSMAKSYENLLKKIVEKLRKEVKK